MIIELKEGFEMGGGGGVGKRQEGVNLEKEVGYLVMKMWG